MDLLQKTSESNMKSQLLVFLSLFCFWTVISEMPKSMNAEEGLPEDVLRMIAQADIRSINDLEDLLGIEAKDSPGSRPKYKIGVPLWLEKNKSTNEHPGQKANNDGRPLHLSVLQESPPQSQPRSFIAGYSRTKSAGCKTRVVSVEVPRYKVDPTSAGFFLWPSCVEIERCSGCCNTKTYKCIPSLANYRPFQIAKLTYRYGRKELTMHTVTIREHLSCNCTELATLHQPRFPPKYYRQSTDN
ncbi:platelet-derived growth factor subunit A-like isoform X2 [Heptranchias perlo]|uniref:platelet-derived growth factor subunit A-like isoform X2 n=1 Tax=Heptranchias perlo TaxID=212740 RepID=UPI00355A1BD8